MPSTTICKRGEIALVRFVFADEEGAKRRPVLIISTEAFPAALRQELTALLPRVEMHAVFGMSEALMIAKREHLLIPLHQQPMAWAIRGNVTAMVQASDNKPRLWLTQMQ